MLPVRLVALAGSSFLETPKKSDGYFWVSLDEIVTRIVIRLEIRKVIKIQY
jgi:hypothetical protein